LHRNALKVWRGLALGAALLLAAGAARAQDAPATAADPPAKTQVISERDAAVLLIQAHRLTEARRVLIALERADPRDNQVQFLLGMIAMEEKAYPEAIRRFRRILAREPRSVRVRLELGRAFYLAKDYDNAERQFRLARAGDLPPTALANVDQYLFAIRQERRISTNLSLAIAPDTNLNAGPSLSAVDIFGLPFQLSSDARQRSGVGIALGVGGEWSPPISGALRLRMGAQFDGVHYPSAGAFDDMTLGVYAGPRLVYRRWDVSLLATGFERWYGRSFYNSGVGGSLQATFFATPRLGVTASLGAQQVTYRPPAGQGGPAVSGSLGGFYTASPTSVVSGGVSVSRQDAGQGVYSNTATQVQIGYFRDLPGGFSASIQPSIAHINYDAAQAGFGVPRRDRQWQLRATLLDRRIDIAGFTPKLTYVHTDNASDIGLFRYRRDQAQIGVTRSF
jgi:tetratricopeptide (TPR) repeat protein